MLLTEEEAKTKWCPHSRMVVGSEDGADCSVSVFNRYVSRDTMKIIRPTGTNCFASSCMQWRWRSYGEADENIGYCGLSGKPE